MLTEGKSVKTSAIFICDCSNTGTFTSGYTTRSQEDVFFPFEDLIWSTDFIISAIIYADRSPYSRILSSPSLLAAFLQVQPQWFMKWIHEKHRKNQLFRVTCKLNKYLLLANFRTAEAKRTSKIYQYEQCHRGETLFPSGMHVYTQQCAWFQVILVWTLFKHFKMSEKPAAGAETWALTIQVKSGIYF